MRCALSIDWCAVHTAVLWCVGKPLNYLGTADLLRNSSPSRHTHVLSHPDIQGRAQAYPMNWESKESHVRCYAF